MKFDLHMHTCRYSPDSVIDPYELVEHAVRIGLDGIVLTEHDRLWPEDELDELRSYAPRLTILGGVEVTGKQGDVLCYGIQSLDYLPKGIHWVDLCQEVHRQGGVCVAAHPFRWEQGFDIICEKYQPELDGMEMMSNNMFPEVRAKAAAYAMQQPRFAQLGNSDAHELFVLGRCFTMMKTPVKNNEDLILAIQQQLCYAVDGPLFLKSAS
ncbi:MAG: CehA/McbA family metallohydrolase [Zavarzinella sp.]